MAFYNRGGYLNPITATGYGPWQGQSSFSEGQQGFSPFGGEQQGFSPFGQAQQSAGMGNKRRPGVYQAFSDVWMGPRSKTNYNRSFYSPQPGVSSAGAVNQTATQAQMGGPAVDLSQGRDPAADAERLDKIRNLRAQNALLNPPETYTFESVNEDEQYLAEINSARLNAIDDGMRMAYLFPEQRWSTGGNLRQGNTTSTWIGAPLGANPAYRMGPTYHDNLLSNQTGQYSNLFSYQPIGDYQYGYR